MSPAAMVSCRPEGSHRYVSGDLLADLSFSRSATVIPVGFTGLAVRESPAVDLRLCVPRCGPGPPSVMCPCALGFGAMRGPGQGRARPRTGQWGRYADRPPGFLRLTCYFRMPTSWRRLPRHRDQAGCPGYPRGVDDVLVGGCRPARRGSGRRSSAGTARPCPARQATLVACAPELGHSETAAWRTS